MAQAPRLLDRLDADDAEHFAAVSALLDAAGMRYDVDSTLVRGLDYYTRTVFEFESERLGAQAALGGGGRYDRLIEELGGPPTPGVGWAAGVERILLASEGEAEAGDRVYIALAKPDCHRRRLRAGPPPARRRRAGGDRAGRPLAEGPAQAGRPHRCPGDRDPRRRDRREGHGRAASRARRRGPTRRWSWWRGRCDEGPAPQPLPRPLVRRRARRRRGPDAARGRLGAPPPRPRRADLHRPARPHRPAAARLPARGGPRGPRRSRAPARRGRDLGRRRAAAPRGGHDQPQPARPARSSWR